MSASTGQLLATAKSREDTENGWLKEAQTRRQERVGGQVIHASWEQLFSCPKRGICVPDSHGHWGCSGTPSTLPEHLPCVWPCKTSLVGQVSALGMEETDPKSCRRSGALRRVREMSVAGVRLL